MKALKTLIFGKPKRREVHTGSVGPEASYPSITVNLEDVNTDSVHAVTGPDNGIRDMLGCTPDFNIPWADECCGSSYGEARSLYDVSPKTGRHAGDPIADCFAILSYPTAAVLAVADGVNWGEPARRAARCAVLGTVKHLHLAFAERQQHQQQQLQPEGAGLTSLWVFEQLRESIQSSQKLILAQCGTLTTLVVSVVSKCKASSSGQSVAMTMVIGDSPAFMYCSSTKTVEELTYDSHADTVRDVRWVPGALGHALGESPDLANLCFSLTFLKEGDIVFLVSDGVADNFDPVVLKLAQADSPNREDLYNGVKSRAKTAVESGEVNDGTQPACMDAGQCHELQLQLMTNLVRKLRSDVKRGAINESGTAMSSSPPRPSSGFINGLNPISASTPSLSPDILAKGLLDYVYEVSAAQRAHAEVLEKKKAALAALPRDQRPLATDTKDAHEARLIPGKMDHACIAATMVTSSTRNSLLTPRSAIQSSFNTVSSLGNTLPSQNSTHPTPCTPPKATISDPHHKVAVVEPQTL